MEDKNDTRGLSYFDMQTYEADATIGDIFSEGFSINLFEDVCKDDEGLTTYMMACKNEADETISNLAGKQTKELIAKKWLQRDFEKMFVSAIKVAERIDVIENHEDPQGHHPITYFQSLLHGVMIVYRLAKVRNIKSSDLITEKAAEHGRKIIKLIEHVKSEYIKGQLITGFSKGVDKAIYAYTNPEGFLKTKQSEESMQNEWLAVYYVEEAFGQRQDEKERQKIIEEKIKVINEKYKPTREAEEKRASAFHKKFRKMLIPCQDPECEQMELSGYYKMPSSPTLYALQGLAGNADFEYAAAKQSKRKTVYGQQISIFDTKAYKMEFEFTPKELSKKVLGALSRPTEDILTYVFINGEKIGWKDNSAMFTLEDYMIYRGLDPNNKNKKDYCRKQIIAASKELMGCRVELEGKFKGKNGQKKVIRGTPVVDKYYRLDPDGMYIFQFDEALLEVFREYYGLMPEWAPRLQSYEARKIINIALYKMQASKSGDVNIKMPEILNHLALPMTKGEYRKLYNDRHYERVTEPVRKAIDELFRSAPEDWTIDQTLSTNIEDEFESFLETELIIKADSPAKQHFASQKAKIEARNKKEQRVKARTKNKAAGGAKK